MRPLRRSPVGDFSYYWTGATPLSAKDWTEEAMSVLIPDHATHYHLADKPPFLNLSDLTESQLEPIIVDLAQRRVGSGLKRIFGPQYMSMRRLTESRLYARFVGPEGCRP